MKVYRRNRFYNIFDYPDEMIIILDYLRKRGEIVVLDEVVEVLYRRFSDEKYSAGWVRVDEKRLKEFEKWLLDIEI